MINISIALAVYNGENYIKEAIQSILDQDYKNFELVIADNCSTDDTTSIVREFCNLDARVKLICNEKNVGLVNNFNIAAQNCTYDWIHFFCHDDIMLPGCLKNVANAIESSSVEVALISHKAAWLFGNGKIYAPFNLTNGNSIYDGDDLAAIKPAKVKSSQKILKIWKGKEGINNLLEGKSLYLPALTTAVVKKKVFFELGTFDPDYIHFDIFLWTNLINKFTYVEMSAAYTLTRIHSGQVAVDGRKSLRTFSDHQKFWTTFFQANDIKLSFKNRLTFGLKPARIATGIITVTILSKGLRTGLAQLEHVPFKLWPGIFAYLPFRYRAERKRVKPILKFVPVEMIYP